jgi:hypothetical protein
MHAKFYLENLKGMYLHGSLDARNIKMNHKEIRYECVGRIHLLQGRVIRFS